MCPVGDLNHLDEKSACRRSSAVRLVPTSMQLAFARQDAKERGKSNDDGRRSDDSYVGAETGASEARP